MVSLCCFTLGSKLSSTRGLPALQEVVIPTAMNACAWEQLATHSRLLELQCAWCVCVRTCGGGGGWEGVGRPGSRSRDPHCHMVTCPAGSIPTYTKAGRTFQFSAFLSLPWRYAWHSGSHAGSFV